MKFKRIDDNSFQCDLTREDMDEYDISLDDFMKDKEKVSDFLHKLIEIGGDEVHFNPGDNSMLTMQISPMPDDGLRLILSTRNGKDDFMNVLKSLMKASAGLSGLPDLDDKSAEDENINSPLSELADLFKGLAEEKEKTGKRGKQKSKLGRSRLYAFDTLKDLECMAQSIPLPCEAKSRLYYDDLDGSYYLLVEQGKMDSLAYARLCETLIEYGSFASDDPARIALIEEHIRLLVASQAINTIKEI